MGKMEAEEMLVELLKATGILEIEDCLYSAEYLNAHGVTVREAKKPLTLEEAQSIWPRMAYVEKRGMEMTPFPVLLVQDMDKEHIRALEFGRAWRLLLPAADYGRMYRLWDGLPTEKERRDARWTES